MELEIEKEVLRPMLKHMARWNILGKMGTRMKVLYTVGLIMLRWHRYPQRGKRLREDIRGTQYDLNLTVTHIPEISHFKDKARVSDSTPREVSFM